MSYFEYNDLFMKCQENGKYHVFCFDIVDSKEMDKKLRYEVQYLLFELAHLMVLILQNEEKSRNSKILLNEDGISSIFDKNVKVGFGPNVDPVVLGDTLVITVYRDAITTEEVYSLFENCKSALGLNLDFHCADGYYETNDWVEAKDKYFRGYCIQLLSNLHKGKDKDVEEYVFSKIKKEN